MTSPLEPNPIPDTIQQLNEELQSNIMLGSSSSSRRMELLECAKQSFDINRSHKKCIVMLAGETGVGKSSLLNHIFNRRLCKVSEVESETRSVEEFTAQVDVPDLDVINLGLSLVDTPGLFDTAGLDQDARNVFAVQTYLSTVLGYEIFPNVVLLLAKADDNRIFGERSRMSMLIKCLKVLKMIDLHRVNLIVVISHARNICGRNAQMLLQEKKKQLQELIRDTCSIEVPVVFVENEPSEYDDMEFDESQGRSTLPSGEIQPQHLFNEMLELLERNNDSFGRLAVLQLLASDDWKPRATSTYKLDASTRDSGPLSKEEARIRSLLEDSGEKSEVQQLLHLHLEDLNVEKFNVHQYDLENICAALVEDHDVSSLDCLRQYSFEDLKTIFSDVYNTDTILAFANIFDLERF